MGQVERFSIETIIIQSAIPGIHYSELLSKVSRQSNTQLQFVRFYFWKAVARGEIVLTTDLKVR